MGKEQRPDGRNLPRSVLTNLGALFFRILFFFFKKKFFMFMSRTRRCFFLRSRYLAAHIFSMYCSCLEWVVGSARFARPVFSGRGGRNRVLRCDHYGFDVWCLVAWGTRGGDKVVWCFFAKAARPDDPGRVSARACTGCVARPPVTTCAV